MKNSVKRILAVFMTAALLMITVPFAVSAAETTYTVETWDELDRAVQEINTAGAGEYIISLGADITGNGGITFNKAGEVVTIKGNGHTFYSPVGYNVVVFNGAFLKLGDGTTALTLKGGVNNDVPGWAAALPLTAVPSTCTAAPLITAASTAAQSVLAAASR